VCIQGKRKFRTKQRSDALNARLCFVLETAAAKPVIHAVGAVAHSKPGGCSRYVVLKNPPDKEKILSSRQTEKSNPARTSLFQLRGSFAFKEVISMWNEPSKERLSRIPRLYETEDVPLREKLIYLHFFIAGCDWYVVEYDGEDLFFGFAILNHDLECAEWGYVSFAELKELKLNRWLEVDCETEDAWKIRQASEIECIKTA
jgi:hypothetical protein